MLQHRHGEEFYLGPRALKEALVSTNPCLKELYDSTFCTAEKRFLSEAYNPNRTLFQTLLIRTAFDWLVSRPEAPEDFETFYSSTCRRPCSSYRKTVYLQPIDLFPVLKKRLCDVRWEVRDSALEFLTQLTLNFQGKTEFPPILLSSGILKLLLDLLSDSESYVRASAVTALGQTAYITNNNEENLNSESGTSVQEDVASRLVDILAQDTEGFPRRAVVKVFADWLKQRSRLTIQNFEESAASVLKYGSNDLDWEVKIHSLEMAEVYINQTLSKSISACPYAVVQSTNSKNETLTESLQKLFNLKIFEVLLAGLYDCDRPVAQKACTILISLKQVIFEDREALNLKGLTWAPDILSKCFSKHSKMEVCGGTNSSLQAGGDLVEILSILDLETMQQALERSSDYIENSPRSLLQDILAATETTEDNAIDCY